MTIEPDSEATNFASIEVGDTPERDNPKFGAVTLTIGRAQGSNTIRMTMDDADALLRALTEFMDQKQEDK